MRSRGIFVKFNWCKLYLLFVKSVCREVYYSLKVSWQSISLYTHWINRNANAISEHEYENNLIINTKDRWWTSLQFFWFRVTRAAYIAFRTIKVCDSSVVITRMNITRKFTPPTTWLEYLAKDKKINKVLTKASAKWAPNSWQSFIEHVLES